MDKKTADKIFKSEYLPHLPKGDYPAIFEAWNDWTDSLCKDGEITEKQYNEWQCPVKDKRTFN